MAADTKTAAVMQHLTVEQVNRIAALGEAYAADLTARLGAEPDPERISAEVQSGSAPKAAALVSAIEALSREARYELIALVWCGQGEYSFTEARAYSQATSDQGTSQYIAKKAPILSDLLNKALATLD